MKQLKEIAYGLEVSDISYCPFGLLGRFPIPTLCSENGCKKID